MGVKVLLFGQLREITGHASLVVENVLDSSQLINEITTKYPALKSMKFLVSVDRKVVATTTTLTSQQIVALLPPFSGG
jgi:sulfur-carrier protein